MAEAKRYITFVCGFCEQPIRAPAASEGRVGKCPNCKQPVIAPQVDSTVGTIVTLHSAMGCHSGTRLRELIHGAAVSLALHAILLSILAVIIIKSPELGRTLLVTLMLDTEGTEVVKNAEPDESPVVIMTHADGGASSVAGTFAGDRSTIDGGPGSTGTGTSTGGRVVQAPTATERLSRQPAAKRGDYEIALFWDGISDLDVHVHVNPAKKKTPFKINYVNKGKPETGFLDVDQNAHSPFVDDPIEHIRWDTKTPPAAVYSILVHGFQMRGPDMNAPEGVPFTLEIKTPQGLRSYSGNVRYGQVVEIDRLAIGMSIDDDTTGNEEETPVALDEREAKKLLAKAKGKLQGIDPRSMASAKLMLRNLRRKYPSTVAGREAESLLKAVE